MERLQLRCVKAFCGSVDGLKSRDYVTGEVYELPVDGPEGLAGVALREGWMVLADGPESDDAEEPADEDPDGAEGAGENMPRDITGGEQGAGEDAAGGEDPDSLSPNRCEAIKRSNGERCKSDALPGSRFCSVPAHQKQGEPE